MPVSRKKRGRPSHACANRSPGAGAISDPFESARGARFRPGGRYLVGASIATAKDLLEALFTRPPDGPKQRAPFHHSWEVRIFPTSNPRIFSGVLCGIFPGTWAYGGQSRMSEPSSKNSYIRCYSRFLSRARGVNRDQGLLHTGKTGGHDAGWHARK